MPNAQRPTPNALLALLGAVLLLSGCPGKPKTAAQKPKKPPPPVNMVVEVGHANCARTGRTIPIRVTLNQNEKPISGRLELDDLRGGHTETPIDLPRGANKVYTLYAELSQDAKNYSSSGESAEIRVNEGGGVVAKQLLTPVYPNEGSVLLSATGDGSGLQFLQDQQKYRVAHVSPPDMPKEWPGYNAVDVVAVNGRAWAAMDDGQRRALRTWVENGGRAILCGESSTEWRDPDAQALAAIVPTRIRTEPSLHCLDVWGDIPFRPHGGTLLTVSGPLQAGARVVHLQGDHAIVAVRDCVRGRAVWLGFDAFRETLREWEGYNTFWRRALDETRRGEGMVAVNAPEQVDDARAAANALPRLPAPPLGAILAFGVIYAAIFGPLNIWILRRLRRTVRSWLFVPGLALGMTLVVLLAGQMWGNARTVLNSVSVLQTVAGSRAAREETLVGLFSPTNRAFDLSVDDPAPSLEDRGSADPQDAAAVALGWPDHQNEGTTRWDAVPLVIYSTRLLGLNRPRELSGTLEAKLDWSGANRFRPSGTVVNGTNVGLKGAYLHLNGRRQWIGELPAAGQFAVKSAGWKSRLEDKLPEEATAAQLQENRRFRESIGALWAHAPDAILSGPGRDELWLVGECRDFECGLKVAQIPYNNQAGLMLVRIPRPKPQ